MTTIKVNPLSGNSISDAQHKLIEYKKNLQAFPELFVKALTNRFEELLGQEAPEMAGASWNAYVRYSDDGHASGIIEFDGKVEFVEFGTGVVGKKNHAGINEEWLKKLPPPYTEYNAGAMIHHFENEDMDYWAYFADGKWHITHGVPADPFIYRSVCKLMDERVKIAKEVLKLNG